MSPIIILTILALLFGASLGSFAKVIADRMGVLPILNSRSKCLNCNQVLKLKDMIPVFSYFFKKGRCSNCKSKISSLYIWSELICGVLIASLPFILSSRIDIFISNLNLFYAIFLFFALSISITLCFAIIIYDLRHMLVPVELAFSIILIGIVTTLFRQVVYGFNIYDFFAGVLVASPYTILYLLSKGKWVGLGDILIYSGLGFLLGLSLGMSMFFISIWLGALVSVSLMIFHKHDYNLKSEIPFTPFIILGALIAFIFNINILGII